MNDKQLSAIVAVTEEGSINLAASRLYITPSGLFKQINSLENELGIKLLNRGKRGIELTTAGKIFYEGAKESLDFWHDVLSQTKAASRSDKKTIVIGSWSVICYSILPQLTSYVQMKYPELQIEYRNITGIPAMQHALEHHEIDITISFGGPSKATSRLRRIPLAQEKPYVLIPINSGLPLRTATRLADLNGATLVTTEDELSGWHEYLNSYMREHFPATHLHAIRENEPGILAMQRLSAPAIGARGTFSSEGMFVSSLILEDDFEKKLISLDLLCRKEQEPVVEEFAEAAREAARIIWFENQSMPC